MGRLRVIFWEVWSTNTDLGSGAPACTACSPLDGNEYIRGEGPHPPMHWGCRCTREYLRTEVTSEDIVESRDDNG